MKAVLFKVKFNKGKLDDGTEYDYTKVYFMMPIFEQSTSEFGMDLMECVYGDCEKHKELLPLKGKLPVEVDFDIEQAMKGGRIVNIASNIRLANAKQVKPE